MKVVGVPTHLAKSGMERPVFHVCLTGVPAGWVGGTLELPQDLRSRPKHYVLVCNAPRAASSYQEVGKGRAVPRVVPAAPAPLQDEGGTGDMTGGGDGDEDGMAHGESV